MERIWRRYGVEIVLYSLIAMYLISILYVAMREVETINALEAECTPLGGVVVVGAGKTPFYCVEPKGIKHES
jgi:hypothetical protein